MKSLPNTAGYCRYCLGGMRISITGNALPVRKMEISKSTGTRCMFPLGQGKWLSDLYNDNDVFIT
jgi:hypothetical protein